MTWAALLQWPPACLLAAAALVLHLAYTLHASVRPANPLFSGSLSPCILQPCIAAIASVSPFCASAGPGPRVRTSSRAASSAADRASVRLSVLPGEQWKKRGRKAAREATESRLLFLPSSLTRRSPSGLHVLSLNEGGVVPVHYNDIQAPIHSATV